MTATQKLSSKVLQEMIDDRYNKEFERGESWYSSSTPGASPAQVSFQKTNEIYSTLATPLKNMRAQAMLDAASKCYRDKWMDDTMPNPH